MKKFANEMNKTLCHCENVMISSHFTRNPNISVELPYKCFNTIKIMHFYISLIFFSMLLTISYNSNRNQNISCENSIKVQYTFVNKVYIKHLWVKLNDFNITWNKTQLAPFEPRQIYFMCIFMKMKTLWRRMHIIR